MKKIKFLLSILLAVVLLALTPNSVFATQADDDTISDNIEISFETDKTDYEEGEEIDAVIRVKNTNSFRISNYTVFINVPNGWYIKDDSSLPTSTTLGAGKSATYKVTFVKGEAPKASSFNKRMILWFGIFALFLGVLISGFTVLGHNTKRKKAVIASMLVVSVLVGLFSTNMTAKASTFEHKSSSVSISVNSGDSQVYFTAMLSYDRNEQLDKMNLDTSSFSYLEDEQALSVSSELDVISGTLKKAKKYDSITLEVYTNHDALVYTDEIPASADWAFENVGLFPGRNKVVITAIGKKNVAIEFYVYDNFGFNYNRLPLAGKDSDSDGLEDLEEDYYGSDSNNPDTDGDGLNDYQEVYEVHTQPSVPDSDNDGVSDYDADADEDGISNGDEYLYGTDPSYSDSDFDGLDDGQELSMGADPTLSDTDGDGAEDGWEVDNGYSPGAYNDAFVVTAEFGEPDEYLPVTASVQVTASGTETDVTSLSVEPVSVYDNPYLTQSVAGYLGDAYEFTYDGDFSSAQLTFYYDESVVSDGTEFQPRIYWFDEDTQSFVELENQSVSNGQVTATTTHFSLYALLDKFAVDLVNAASSADQFDTSLGSASYVFAVDTSASMGWNDADNMRGDIINYLIEQMRDDYDYAAILGYTTQVQDIITMSNNKEALSAAVRRIETDTGLNEDSGTDGSAVLERSIQMIGENGAVSRVIYFITDGNDNHFSNSYADLIERAQKQEIRICPVVLNAEYSESLEQLAASTGGTCFYINENSPSLAEIFGDFTSNLAATVTDSNGDGLCDYYTQLIYEGQIRLSTGSTELAGINMGDNPDVDGDGLLNGEEISVAYQNGKLVIRMKSNPFMKYSDADPYDDYYENNHSMDPMHYSLDAEYTDNLLNNSNFHYELAYEELDFTLYIDRWISGVYNLNEVYFDLMVDYFVNYQDSARYLQLKYTQEVMTSTCNAAILTAYENGATDDQLLEIYQIKDFTFTAKLVRDFDTSDFSSKIGGLADWITVFGFEFNIVATHYITTVLETRTGMMKAFAGGISDKIGAFGNGLVIVNSAIDLVDSVCEVAKVSSCADVFIEAEELLTHIKCYTSNYNARAAAGMILNELHENAFGQIRMMFDEILENGVIIASLYAFGGVIGTTQTIFNALTGMSTDTKEAFSMICYHEMGIACEYLICRDLTKYSSASYSVEDEDIVNELYYIANLIQIRMLGEHMYYSWRKADGFLNFGGILTEEIMNAIGADNSINEVLKVTNNHVSRLGEYAVQYHLFLDDGLISEAKSWGADMSSYEQWAQ